jgi:hypothetical protein
LERFEAEVVYRKAVAHKQEVAYYRHYRGNMDHFLDYMDRDSIDSRYHNRDQILKEEQMADHTIQREAHESHRTNCCEKDLNHAFDDSLPLVSLLFLTNNHYDYYPIVYCLKRQND